MKISSTFFVLCFFFIQAKAQDFSKLSGTIRDQSGEAVPFANVSLLEESASKLITGTVTDQNGKFLIQTDKSGNFYLSISSIGFKTFTSETFEIKPGINKDFGILQIQEEISSLDEVTVRAARPDVIIEPDKTIVTIEGTAMAEGSTALDVIGRSPGVYVDADGNINLNGQSGITVLIDDRPTYMSANDLANFLRAMPADNIKSIEVINSPGSRFDAEGVGGIINIKLKKNNIEGIHGNINLGNRYNGLHAPFAGATVNIKKGKWTNNASFNHSQFANDNHIDIFRTFVLPEGTSNFDQRSVIRNQYKSYFFNGGSDYEINSLHSVGMSLQASKNHGTSKSNAFTHFNDPSNDMMNYMRSLNDNKSGSERIFINLHYNGKLDTLGSKLTSDVDFTRMSSYSLGLLTNNSWHEEEREQDASRDYLNTDNNMFYNIFTAKADYTKSFGKGKVWETGAKGSWMMSDNDLKLSRSLDGVNFTPDINSNAFIYRENILALYTSYKGSLSDKISFQAGLRAEHSHIEGNSVTLGEVNAQKYLSLFPSMSVQHKISDAYQVNYNANRRISRPNYRLLNPFIFYIDPLTYEQGNPGLRPQFSNNFEMNHVIKGSYQVSLSYSMFQDVFQQIFLQDEETRTTSTFISNFDQSDNLGIKLTAPVEFTKWWNTSNMAMVNRNSFKSQIGDALLDRNLVSYTLRSQHNIILPKGFKLEVMGIFIGPSLYGQTYMKSMGWVDAGITKSFAKDKLSLTLNGTDLFRTQVYRVDIQFDKMDGNFRQYISAQGARVTLRYNFARGESFKVHNRTGSSEERNRLD